jgi:hypothetical protein
MTHATIVNQVQIWKNFSKEKYSLTKENYDLLEKVDFFEQLQVDND